MSAPLFFIFNVNSYAYDLKKMVPSGANVNVDHFYSVYEDCSPTGEIVVRIKTQPSHGKVVVKKGTGYTNFKPENPRNACNTKKLPVINVEYTSENNYFGNDYFGLLVLYPNGNGEEYYYNIEVK